MEYKKAIHLFVWLNFFSFLTVIVTAALGETSDIIKNCEIPEIKNFFIVMVLIIIALIFLVIGLISVYRFKSYGRVLLLISAFLILLSTSISGTLLSDAILDSFETLNDFFFGALLALCWIPAEAKEAFEIENLPAQ